MASEPMSYGPGQDASLRAGSGVRTTGRNDTIGGVEGTPGGVISTTQRLRAELEELDGRIALLRDALSQVSCDANPTTQQPVRPSPAPGCPISAFLQNDIDAVLGMQERVETMIRNLRIR